MSNSDYHYLSTILQNNSSCFSLQKSLQFYIRPQNRNEKERKKKNSWCSTEDLQTKLEIPKPIKQQPQPQQRIRVKIAYNPTIRLRNSFLNGKNQNNYSLNHENSCTCCHLTLHNKYSNLDSSFSTIVLETFQQQNSQIITTKCNHKFHYECFNNHVKSQLDQMRCQIICTCGKKISQQFISQFSYEVLFQRLLKIQLQAIVVSFTGNTIKQCLSCSFFWVKLQGQSNMPLCIYCLLSKSVTNTSIGNVSKNRRLRSISYQ